jgi:galactokinase
LSQPERSAGWWAPGRVNLIGDHTDYNGGLVLPFAIPLGTTVTARETGHHGVELRSARRPGEEVAASIAVSPDQRSGTWADYVLGCVWALGRAGVQLRGVDIRVDGDLPVGAGLSSSASLTCATTLALCDLHGVQLGPMRVAALARQAENDFVGAPVGLMDPVVVTQATAQHATLFDATRLTVQQVPLDVSAAGYVLLVIDTGVRHRVSEGAYAERVAQCRAAAQELGVASLAELRRVAQLERLTDPVLVRRARHVLTENARVRQVVELLGEHRLDEIGTVLTRSHVSLRDDFEVSTPELDAAVAACLDAGAAGARLTGAGFGGSVLALVPDSHRDEVERHVVRTFHERGWAPPRTWAVVPGSGARRVPAEFQPTS